MAPQDIPYADYAGHFHRRMLQVTLSLVDVILFHGVMTAVLMCVAVKYRGVIENCWVRITSLASASSRSLIVQLFSKKDEITRKRIAELEGEVLTLLGLNKELRDTLNELERYCLGLERQLELHPSVPPPFTPVPVPAPAPLPILQARDVTVEPQERREYIEHDGQLQHMDNIDQRSYAEAVGQNPVTVQQEESDRGRSPLPPLAVSPLSHPQPSAPQDEPTGETTAGETKAKRMCMHGSQCKQARRKTCRFDHPELKAIGA